MEITVAKNAGFCFGVKRATDSLENAIANREGRGRIYTLGTLIHNDTYNEMLREAGTTVIKFADAEKIAKEASEESPATVFIRAHGIPKNEDEALREYERENPFFKTIDCTCPFVKKIHKIAEKYSAPENVFLLLGEAEHPEVVGIMSYFEYDKYSFANSAELEREIENGLLGKINNKTPILAVQTTQKLVEWKKCQEILQKLCTNTRIFDTICSATDERQREARELSQKSDVMIVIGGKESANTAKLYAVCKEKCPQTVRIERANELAVYNLITHPHAKVGIAAGASTPSGVIQEVHDKMSEMNLNENFEAMLAESFKTLDKGDIVTGTVTAVTDAEIQLDLGAQVTGIIRADQITDDPSVKLTELFKKGDLVEARVFRVW